MERFWKNAQRACKGEFPSPSSFRFCTALALQPTSVLIEKQCKTFRRTWRDHITINITCIWAICAVTPTALTSVVYFVKQNDSRYCCEPAHAARVRIKKKRLFSWHISTLKKRYGELEKKCSTYVRIRGWALCVWQPCHCSLIDQNQSAEFALVKPIPYHLE